MSATNGSKIDKLIALPFELTGRIAGFISLVFIFLVMVTWVAASEAILLVAPIVVYSLGGMAILAGVIALVTFAVVRSGWMVKYRAEFKRDAILAQAEADRVRLENDRERMCQQAQGRLLAATVRQVERGLIHPATLVDAKFSAFPVAVSRSLNDTPPLLEQPETSIVWPDKIELFDLLPSKNGNLDNIVLGININETGQQTIIQTPLEEMVHGALGGETNTGKSTLAYSIAYQIATAPQDAQLILADPAGTTWKTMSDCERLMFPLIGDEHECMYALEELHEITKHRTDEVFAPYPTVEKLSDYNRAVSPGERLEYIVMMIDEFPEYLEDKDLQVSLRRLIRKSRKAGIYIFGMGTSWKHSDMDTSIKRQFRTKVHFAASDAMSSRVLLDSKIASELKVLGRAYARLPFGTSADLVEIQTPYIDKKEAMEVMAGSILDLPVARGANKPNLTEQAVIVRYQETGSYGEAYRTWHQVAKGKPYGGGMGGNQRSVVKEILDRYGVAHT